MDGGKIRYDGPGMYAITTKEEVNHDIFELFNVKKIQGEPTDGSNADSQLIFEIKDQSELLSFLTVLFDHHHTILRLELLSNNNHIHSTQK